MDQEFSDEVLQNDRYRIFLLNNGQNIIGRIMNSTAYGILIKNPVICSIEDTEVFFNVLFNGMSKSRNFFFPAAQIVTIGLVDEDIKKYYEKYLKDTFEEFKDFKAEEASEYEYQGTKPTSNAMAQLLNSIKGTIH
tara:strand:- start:844 stop:1251 length:408 start_codon:yes stop_codon:yes gene_type:complete